MGKVDPLHPDLAADPLGILRPNSKLVHQLPLVIFLSLCVGSTAYSLWMHFFLCARILVKLGKARNKKRGPWGEGEKEGGGEGEVAFYFLFL